MKASREKISEHYNLFRLSLIQDVKEIDNLQYSIFDHEDKKAVYIHGSNESKDWVFNIAIIGIFFHLAYMVLAFKIKGRIDHHKKIVLIGKSFGGGVAACLYWIMRKQVEEVIVVGAPPALTIINPLYSKKIYNYRIKNDVIRWASWLNPFFRQAARPNILPKVNDDAVDTHYNYYYLMAFKKILQNK